MKKYESLGAALDAAHKLRDAEPGGSSIMQVFPDRVVLFTRWEPKPGKIYEGLDTEPDEYKRKTEFYY